MLFGLSFNFSDIEFVYQAITFVLSIGLIISALEDIRSWPIFESKGLLSWKVSKLIDKWYARGLTSKLLHAILNDRFFLLSFYLRLIFAIGLLVLSLLGVVSSFLLFCEFILLSLIFLRSPYSLDGSYQMFLITLLGLSLGSMSGVNSSVGMFCIWFIAAQLTLCYFISGFVKLLSPFWRKGYALNMVFGTQIYGNAAIYNLVTKSQIFSVVLAWSVMLFETFFFTVFFFDFEHALFFILGGFLFHLANAVFMGLNGFLLAFLATYPAVLYFVVTKQPLYFLIR